jgi:predicted permease
MLRTSLRVFVSRLLDFAFRGRRDRRLADEIAGHLADLTDDYVRQGLPPAEARLAARRAFGGVDQLTLRYRDARGLPLVDTVLRDLRFAARLLVKDRWFTAAIVVVLGVGIGVNTTMFTIVNGMNLRGLPVPRGHQIVMIDSLELEGRRLGLGTSFADFRDWQRATQTLSGLAAYAPGSMNLGDDARPADRLAGFRITANAFALLGIPPSLGRDFSSADDRIGAPPVAMLSHAVWSDRYQRDPSVIGRTIRINGTPTTVIGVMPEGFRFPVRADVWQPLGQFAAVAAGARDERALWVFGRLRDGATIDDARAEFAAIAAGLAAQYPATNAAVGTRVDRFTEVYVGPATEGPPMLLLASAFFVLLIACANAANLLLARGAHRARELTLRAALGASRARIIGQLLAESLSLSAVAGGVGLIVAAGAVRLFTGQTVDLNLPYWIAFELDRRVFAYVALLCLGTAVTFGLAPAWQMSRTSAHDALKDSGRHQLGGVRTRRWAASLLVAELACTMMLLAGASLLLASARALYDADAIVFAPNVLTAQVALPAGTYATPDERRAFHARLQERLDTTPAIAVATLASARPFVDSVSMRAVLEGEAATAGPARVVQTVAIGERYFEALGLPMIRGRALTRQDGAPGGDAVVINERFATLHFAGRDPIGGRIRLAELSAGATPGAWLTVVGVSPSIRQRPMGPAAAIAYLPLAAQPGPFTAVVVRGSGDAAALAAAVREQVRAVDEDAAAYTIEPLERLSAKSRWTHRMMGVVITLFAAIAMLLSAAGLYAVTAYGVSQRTSEIGVRLALGAQRSAVAWLFLRATLWPVGLGLAIGVAGAAAVGQLVRGLLVNTSPADPRMFATIAAVLIATAALACVIPVRRASRLDPAVALRRE